MSCDEVEMKEYVKNALPHISYFLNSIKLHKHNYFKNEKWEKWKTKSSMNVVFRWAAETFKKYMETANGKKKKHLNKQQTLLSLQNNIFSSV